MCALTEDLRSVLTAGLGRTSVVEGIFGSFFTWEGCFLNWGGGRLSSSLSACPSGPREGSPMLGCGGWVELVFCEADGTSSI